MLELFCVGLFEAIRHGHKSSAAALTEVGTEDLDVLSVYLGVQREANRSSEQMSLVWSDCQAIGPPCSCKSSSDPTRSLGASMQTVA